MFWSKNKIYIIASKIIIICENVYLQSYKSLINFKLI